jgi:hypothetical protein
MVVIADASHWLTLAETTANLLSKLVAVFGGATACHVSSVWFASRLKP